MTHFWNISRFWQGKECYFTEAFFGTEKKAVTANAATADWGYSPNGIPT